MRAFEKKHDLTWLELVKWTLRENPGKSFKQVLKIAKKTYRKSKKASSKGARKSRRHHKTRRGGSSGSGSGSGEQNMSEAKQQQGGNKHEGEMPAGLGKQQQQGGSSGNPLADLMKGAGSSQKGGSGTGGGGSKAEFGANAGSV